MSSNESIFTTEPFPTRTERKIVKQRRRIIKRVTTFALVGVIAAGIGGFIATQDAVATSQATVNRFIRDAGGIPPCKWEDGSGQPGICFFDSRVRGNKKGDVIVLVPVKGADDKKVVVLINR
jgi:hypothetical protein